MKPEDILLNVILMSYDANHPWWIEPPYPVVEDSTINYSYSLLGPGDSIQIVIRRKYDLIHELIHVFMFLSNFDDCSNEIIANLSELLEQNSLLCFPNSKLNYFF